MVPLLATRPRVRQRPRSRSTTVRQRHAAAKRLLGGAREYKMTTTAPGGCLGTSTVAYWELTPRRGGG